MTIGISALFTHLQGKGNWAVGTVADDIRAAILRLFSHLLLPQGIAESQKSILALMTLAALIAILLPPWTSDIDYPSYHVQQFYGYGFVLAPPSLRRSYQSMHIDYGRLGLEFVSILLTGGLLALLSGSPRSRGVRVTNDKADKFLQSVVRGFHCVADKRGESLSDAQLKRICAFFSHQQQTLGTEFSREHLVYELEKYEREGLRSDYRA